MKELMGLADSSIYQVYSSICKDVFDVSLDKLTQNLTNETYQSYLSGTDSKLGIWWDRIKPKWGEKDTKDKVTFSCPLDVFVLDSLGQQIGYAGEDDVWFGSNIIYIEEKGDAKIIYSFYHIYSTKILQKMR